MLTVNKINNTQYNISAANKVKTPSFGSNAAVRETYYNINNDVYVDYVDGDISLPKFLASKLKNFWNIVFKQDPFIEIKAQMIEESLKANAQKGLELDQQV